MKLIFFLLKTKDRTAVSWQKMMFLPFFLLRFLYNIIIYVPNCAFVGKITYLCALKKRILFDYNWL